MGKTSRLLDKLKRKNIICFETDDLRPRLDIKIEGLTVDDFAWVCVRHIMKHYLRHSPQSNLAFLGVACEPKCINQLESESGTEMRTALIGSSKQFHRFERYPKPEPSEEKKSSRLEMEVKELKLSNCEYFDLVKFASPEERDKHLVRLTEKEVATFADKIINRLIRY